MRQFGIAAHLEALVSARRTVGITMVDTTPVKESEHKLEKSQLENVVEPAGVQVEPVLVEPECDLGTVEPNSVELARVDKKRGLSGVSSSEQYLTEETASRVLKIQSAGDADAEASCQLGCDGEQCEQCEQCKQCEQCEKCERGVRPSWDPGDRVSQLALRRDCQALTGRKTLGAV